MRRTRSPCCARAATGQWMAVAAPASRKTNWRRVVRITSILMALPEKGRPDPAPAYHAQPATAP